jgi:hypothetical protein
VKKALIILALLAVIPTFSGCAGTVERVSQNLQKEVGGGYHARVTFYSLDGKELRVLEGRVLPINDDGGEPSISFIMDGKKITLQGLFLIEEI